MTQITGITLGREREQPPTADEAPADGAVSALVEIGLRAAEQGNRAHALAQAFALPPHARAEYRELIGQILGAGRKNGIRLDPFGNETLRRIEDAA